MLPEQRAAVLRTIMAAPGGRELDLAGFARVTGIADPASWALQELLDALERRDDPDVQNALILGALAGVDERWVRPLIEVLESTWTCSHEDAAEHLGDLRDARAVPALVRASGWVPAYLEHDESRALAITCAYALAKIPGQAAAGALRELADHDDHHVRTEVERARAWRRHEGPADR